MGFVAAYGGFVVGPLLNQKADSRIGHPVLRPVQGTCVLLRNQRWRGGGQPAKDESSWPVSNPISTTTNQAKSAAAKAAYHQSVRTKAILACKTYASAE
jgi:hypothetical protein